MMLVRSAAIMTALVAAVLFGARAEAYDRAKVGDVKQAGASPHSAPAKAGAGHSAAGHDAGHGHEQRLYGKPQPNESIQWDPGLFFFTLVLFLLLLYLLNRYAWQPILQNLTQRDQRIDEAVRQADIAREEMQRLSLQTDRDLAAAHEEVRKTLDQVRADASREAEQMLARAKDEAVAGRTQALAAVEQAKREAQESLREASVELAGRMAGRIVDRPVDAAAVRRHVTEG